MKIVVVDDDAVVASSMKTILSTDGEMEVVALGYDGEDAVKLYGEFNPDILLMDIQMQRMSGLEAAQIILRDNPAAKIILLTTFRDDEYVKEALRVGAKGYILKQDFAGVIPAIRAVFSGQNVFGDKIVDILPKIFNEKNMEAYEKNGISDKEYEIIELVAQGLSNKEIADKLCLSDGTVRNYISSVLDKLELRDRTQLAVFYYKH